MKKNCIYLAVVFISLAVVFNSCKKDALIPADPNEGTNNVYDASAMVNSSVSAFVTDENDQPVAGANVSAGSLVTTTDVRGYFQIANAQVVKNAGVVTVEKPGYFKGIKTWIAINNRAAFFRIKLLAKTGSGTVSGTAGGQVALTGGLKISFPANAAVNAATNAAYNSVITVLLKHIDPASTDFAATMPGDLRGLNASGALKGLITYGMAAVELAGSGGELLQMAPGKKATMTMPIPSALLSNAPATIPLWYFDEAKGLWKEEGTATKTGTDFVGDMSHFSFWNYDVSYNYVQFDVTITDAGGSPVPNAVLELSTAAYGVGTGWTNTSGIASGAIPENTQFTLEITAGFNCQVLHSSNFSSANTNVSLGTIALLSNRTVKIFGIATGCGGAPLVNGYVIFSGGSNLMSIPVDNTTGAYAVSFPVCTGAVSQNITVQAIDITNGVQGNGVTATYTPGTNNNVALQACGSTIAEFLSYSYSNGTAYTYNYPPDSVSLSQGNIGFPTNNYYSLYGNVDMSATSSLIQFPSNLVVGQSYNIIFFVDPQVNQQSMTSNVQVQITEFGPVATGFVAGTISGNLTTNGGVNVTVNGSFRSRRPF